MDQSYIDKMKKQVDEFDQQIKNGNSNGVYLVCKKINSTEIPRSLVIDYAEVARRIGKPHLIIRWLRPIIRSEKILNLNPTYKEQSAYAQGLIRIGAFNEAESLIAQILKLPECKSDPQIHFTQASLNINQWRYKSAIPHLKKHLSTPSVNSYSKIVSQLNLCSSLVGLGKHNTAWKEILKLEKKLKNTQYNLIKGNLAEIKSQVLFFLGQYSEARLSLHLASQLLQRADERSLNYVEKWNLLIDLKQTKDNSTINIILEKLLKLREKSVALGDWESVRDIEFQTALNKNDIPGILKVYWGSRFESYKKRILSTYLSEYKVQLDPGVSFIFKFENINLQDEKKLLPFKNTEIYDLVKLAPTKSLKKLFYFLSVELYKPLQLTEISDYLYPNEYYNPITTPAKIHRLIANAREWLSIQKIPVEISIFKNGVKLKFIKSCNIIIHKNMNDRKLENQIEIKEELKNKENFSAHDFAVIYGIADRTARSYLQTLLKKKVIKKLQFRKQPTYTLTKRSAA